MQGVGAQLFNDKFRYCFSTVCCGKVRQFHEDASVHEHGPEPVGSVNTGPDVLGRGLNFGTIEVSLSDFGKAELAVGTKAGDDGIPVRAAAPGLRASPVDCVSCGYCRYCDRKDG